MKKLLVPVACSVWRINGEFRCDYKLQGDVYPATHIESSALDLEQWMTLQFGKRFTRNRFVDACSKDGNFYKPDNSLKVFYVMYEKEKTSEQVAVFLSLKIAREWVSKELKKTRKKNIEDVKGGVFAIWKGDRQFLESVVESTLVF